MFLVIQLIVDSSGSPLIPTGEAVLEIFAHFMYRKILLKEYEVYNNVRIIGVQ